ncbi:hypothetical protein llap_14493 [Limosa lapponica baueri]|uniref:Uncharacterized protein n=1 Tax=Limosa lapponica baueri TaxID=1758121 RepID=A0A2I0TN96_LIMLA|nr:hypothetical protein llap_14493 [Limosa lapponica baueri]
MLLQHKMGNDTCVSPVALKLSEGQMWDPGGHAGCQRDSALAVLFRLEEVISGFKHKCLLPFQEDMGMTRCLDNSSLAHPVERTIPMHHVNTGGELAIGECLNNSLHGEPESDYSSTHVSSEKGHITGRPFKLGEDIGQVALGEKSLASQGNKTHSFEHRAFGFTLICLSLRHLSLLMNLLGIFT